MKVCEKCEGTRGVTTVFFKGVGRKQYSMCMYCIRYAPLSSPKMLRYWLGEGEEYSVKPDYLKFRTKKKGIKHDIKFKFER